jgi:hypothetical protein
LVHYLVEAELRLGAGVFGRAAHGGSSVLDARESVSARAHRREVRRQRKREASLDKRDAEGAGDMARAERLAMLCDIAWRRRRGQHGHDKPWLAPAPATAEEALVVERVVDQLEPVAERCTRSLWAVRSRSLVT